MPSMGIKLGIKRPTGIKMGIAQANTCQHAHSTVTPRETSFISCTLLMKKRFRLVDRKKRGFYCLDSETGKRVSLQTKNCEDAEQIVFAKNQAAHQPNLNRQLAKAYLSGTDSGMSSRTWQTAVDA